MVVASQTIKIHSTFRVPKLCAKLNHILFCGGFIRKAAFNHDNGLAPSRRQAFFVSNCKDLRKIGHCRNLAVTYSEEHTHTQNHLTACARTRYGGILWVQSIFHCRFVFDVMLHSTAMYRECIVVHEQNCFEATFCNLCRFLTGKDCVFIFQIFNNIFTLSKRNWQQRLQLQTCRRKLTLKITPVVEITAVGTNRGCTCHQQS